MATRRRGRELEEAILRAAWSLFLDGGYAAVTMQQVAEDAGTSKPVLYRRWADRDALLGDAMGYGLRSLPLDVPDTGSLRGDLLAVMEQVNQTLVGLTAVMSVHLAGY
ncbi:MAG: helix-turn-helix domain-containing protein, partial [Propionicimonas sp.]|nr:helix-turn-helix domain-containing protein [Propionicimonas sp.]